MDYVKNSEQYSYSYPAFVVLFNLGVTVEEASEYSHIGINKLEELTRNPRCPFVISIGKKRLIKRKEFEQYISDNIEI